MFNVLNSGDNILSSVVSLEVISMCLSEEQPCSYTFSAQPHNALGFRKNIGIPFSWCHFIGSALLLL